MTIGIELVHTRPSTDVAWADDFLNAQTSADFAPIKESAVRFFDAYSETGTSGIKRQHIKSDDNPLVMLVRYSFDGMPDDIDAAYIALRKKQKEVLVNLINDAPYTEAAEQSFDGVARVYPANLYHEWTKRYYLENGIELGQAKFVEVDF